MGPAQTVLEAPDLPRPLEDTAPRDLSLRRFVVAIAVGMGTVAVPYLFVLWDLWTGAIDPLRSVGPADFYELQARAIAGGHLYVPKGKLGVEAFLHGGHAYTYFGIFPSLLRMPVMAVLPSLDGHMTAPSLLLAWLVTGVLASMLLWRVRVLARGAVGMGWGEAASCGLLIAAITGGSVLVFLAANPWVYDEDFAWSVALTLGTVFALLGLMERPTWWRVTGSGLFILAASLNRLATGWACIIGALLVACWFALGRGGPERRRWAIPTLAVGLIPFFIASFVNWTKFGSPFALPLADQVWTQLNAHRRYFLASNGGKGFGSNFLPSTLVAYLQPGGVRFSSLFPFVTLPDSPARAVGNVVLDQTYPTGSIPATMPLLFLLSLWGLVTAFRPKPVGLLRLTRIGLITAAAATAGVLLWGYIADRYLADVMPFLILAGVIGFVDLWRRAASRSRNVRIGLLASVSLLVAFSVVANVGAALESMVEWTSGQATRFVEAQQALGPGSIPVDRGPSLPYWRPAGQLFDVNSCSGLYLSSGYDYASSPGQQLQHATWTPIEQARGINHTIEFTLHGTATDLTRPITLLTWDRTTVLLEPSGPRSLHIVVENPGPAPSWPSAIGPPFSVLPGRPNFLTIMTDPYMHSILVRHVQYKLGTTLPRRLPFGYGDLQVDHYLAGSGPAVLRPLWKSPGVSSNISFKPALPPLSTMSICRSLQPKH